MTAITLHTNRNLYPIFAAYYCWVMPWAIAEWILKGLKK